MTPIGRRVIFESFKYKWSHVPSALSMCDYVYTLFNNKYIKSTDNIVFGKPHGAQAYHIAWLDSGLIKDYSLSSSVIQPGQQPFVDYSMDILGDALGIASGMAYVDDTTTWVNIGDGVLMMGNTLEAIQTIGSRCQNNIILTVDYNKAGRCGYNVMSVDPVFKFMKNYGWDVIEVDGHDTDEVTDSWNNCMFNKPTAFIYRTIKGNGCDFMTSDIMKWHYKIIDESDIRQISI